MARRSNKPVSKHTRESITRVLLENDRAVGRALVVLLSRQTTTEQARATTELHNERGFTSADAHYGTRNAKFFIAQGKLLDFQLAFWRKPNVRGVPKIAKYHRQLIEAAIEKDKLKEACEAA
jgi:hypothetical protein